MAEIIGVSGINVAGEFRMIDGREVGKAIGKRRWGDEKPPEGSSG